VNYLAHAYLSFGDPDITTGNMISDFVKGKKKFDFPARVQAGIQLHRDIDRFTDEHPVNKEVAKIFKPAYGLYSSAFIDIVYDHFLAREIAREGENSLEAFSNRVYRNIETHTNILPSSFNNIFPFMKAHNWLFNYQYGWGIEKSIAGLVHRARYMSDARLAYQLFEEHYDTIQEAYNTFFPMLHNFSVEKFSDIH
jgi:acyl carrier protein phosphodiesterase